MGSMEETRLLYTAGVVALASSSPTHYKHLIFAAPGALSEDVGGLLRAMLLHEDCMHSTSPADARNRHPRSQINLLKLAHSYLYFRRIRGDRPESDWSPNIAKGLTGFSLQNVSAGYDVQKGRLSAIVSTSRTLSLVPAVSVNVSFLFYSTSMHRIQTCQLELPRCSSRDSNLSFARKMTTCLHFSALLLRDIPAPAKAPKGLPKLDFSQNACSVRRRG